MTSEPASSPETALAELYKIPLPGYGIRGMDIDRNGVASGSEQSMRRGARRPILPCGTVSLLAASLVHPGSVGASGNLAKGELAFVRQCALCHTVKRGEPNRYGPNLFGIVNGRAASVPGFKYSSAFKAPKAGVSIRFPALAFKVTLGAAETPYNVWVDQHNILGLGANTPIATGNQSDALHALVGGGFIELRAPYPMGFFARGIDGRLMTRTRAGRGAPCG